jgi:predicted phosphodiesterase
VGRVGQVLFVNPGGAGRKRFRLPRSVALLDLSGPEARAGIVALSPL